MLRCPTCNLLYPDNAPVFCPDDGTRLVPDAQASNLQPVIQGSPYGNAQQQSAPQQYAPQPLQWVQPQARSGGGSKVMIGVLIGLLLASGAVGIYFLTKGSSSPSTGSSSRTPYPSTPTEVWKAMYAAMRSRDVETMKKLTSKNALDRISQETRQESADKYLSGRAEYWSTTYTSETGNEKITGDEATVDIKQADGNWGRATFVKQNGSWKLDEIQLRDPSSSSPTTNPSTPTEVWKAYYAAKQKKDVAAMKKLMSRDRLSRITSDPSSVDDSTFLNLEAEGKIFSSETRNEQISGDQATVEIREPGYGWHKSWFVKEDGSWKFDRQ